jgi:hypothetical protein
MWIKSKFEEDGNYQIQVPTMKNIFKNIFFYSKYSRAIIITAIDEVNFSLCATFSLPKRNFCSVHAPAY